MKRASKFFTEFEKTRIQDAVRDAEAKTSAEIVPVVATSSGRYDRAEDVAGLWLGVILMVVAWFVLKSQGGDDTDWGTPWGRNELPILVASVVVGFAVGTVFTNYVGWLRKLFIPKKQMREEVEAAAARAFFDQRVHHTQGATGLLVYLSLFERTARILGDQKVVDALGQNTLDKLCKEMIENIVAGDPATAVCEAIAHAGEGLADLLPREEGDINEHPDTLIIID